MSGHQRSQTALPKQQPLFRIKMVGFYFLVALMVFVLISDVLKFF